MRRGEGLCFIGDTDRDTALTFFNKNGGVVCEVGVYKGDFAEVILKKLTPQSLLLVDKWDFNFTETGSGREIDSFELVKNRFSGNKNVGFVKGDSIAVAKRMSDNHFDMIYVDADHSYYGVLEDLVRLSSKVKSDGVLCGHDFLDYEMFRRFEGHKSRKGFGVIEAVQTFCRRFDWRLVAISLDFPPSFFLVGPRNDLSAFDIADAALQCGVKGIIAPERNVSAIRFHHTRLENGEIHHTPIL